MGGGTGLSSRLATGIRYLCLDLDHQKLRHFRATHIHSAAVAGDAARCPLRSETVDAVLCAKVAHHLDADQFARVLAEMGRVVKPGGAVIVADAIRSNRLVPRVLWHLDRGSHPRTDRELRAALQPLFDTPVWEEFRAGLFHDFVIFVGRRPQGKRGDLEAGI
jgi:SAM-dependent methyltransferase